MNNIAVVSTTNHEHSLTAQVADYYASLLEKEGCEVSVVKLTDLPDDFTVSALYSNMGKNERFNRLKHIMEITEKYVFIIPEYNGSFPGVFKAFIDGLEFPSTFRGKKCAMVGVSKGPQGGAFAMSHLTDIFHYLRMDVHPLKIRLGNIHNSQLETVLEQDSNVRLLHEQAKEMATY